MLVVFVVLALFDFFGLFVVVVFVAEDCAPFTPASRFNKTVHVFTLHDPSIQITLDTNHAPLSACGAI